MKKLTLFFLCFLFIEAKGQIRQFYTQISNSTILLCKRDGSQLYPHGTAFSIYNYDQNSNDAILVTCEHVTHHDTLIAMIPAADSIRLELSKSGKKKIGVIVDNRTETVDFDGNNFLFKIPLQLNKNLFKHQQLDLAVIFCDIFKTVSFGSKNFELTSYKSLPKSYISDINGIYAGQEVNFIGFPFGIGTMTGYQGQYSFGDLRSNPVLRKGIVSWVSPNYNLMLVDGFSYNGNSGSPIFSIPSVESPGSFIGMVIGHLQEDYSINNIEIDTLTKKFYQGKTRVSVNNGLAQCIPSFIISEFVKDATRKRTLFLNTLLKN